MDRWSILWNCHLFSEDGSSSEICTQIFKCSSVILSLFGWFAACWSVRMSTSCFFLHCGVCVAFLCIYGGSILRLPRSECVIEPGPITDIIAVILQPYSACMSQTAGHATSDERCRRNPLHARVPYSVTIHPRALMLLSCAHSNAIFERSRIYSASLFMFEGYLLYLDNKK